MLTTSRILAEAQARANLDTSPGFPWVLATAVLSHVRWYLQHGAAAGPGSLAGNFAAGGLELALLGMRLNYTPVPIPPSVGIAQRPGRAQNRNMMTNKTAYEKVVDEIKDVAAGRRGWVSLTMAARECDVPKQQLRVVALALGLKVFNHGRNGMTASK